MASPVRTQRPEMPVSTLHSPAGATRGAFWANTSSTKFLPASSSSMMLGMHSGKCALM